MRWSALIFCALLCPIGLGACQKSAPAARPTALGGDSDDAVLDDPDHPGLTFARAPAVATLEGRFEVWLRINDARGLRVDGDSSTMVTLSVAAGNGTTTGAPPTGTLHGTLSRRVTSGLVIFDDLRYDAWEPITLVAQTDDVAGGPGTALQTQRPLAVQPRLRFVDPPATRLPVGDAVGPFTVELVDGRGRRLPTTQPVSLSSSAPQLLPPAETQRPLAAGAVTFDAITIPSAGDVKLTFSAPAVQDLVHVVSAREGAIITSRWLPGARVGVPYATRLDVDGVELGADLPSTGLPRGLFVDDLLQLRGVPAAPAFASFDVFAGDHAVAPRLIRFRLPVLPADETAAAPLDSLDRAGDFTVATLDEPLAVPVRGTTERVRLYYPQELVGQGRRLPVIIFHHGAAPVDPSHPTLYDRFDHYLRRWASHGYVVASVDAVDLAWKNGKLVGATLANLSAMADDQAAALTHLRAVDRQADHLLAGMIDGERVLVAGHSRGAGASLITAANSPAVIGGILLQPLDPLLTAGGEQSWNAPLPGKPFLIVAAGNDGDLPYPMVDFLYERRTAPLALVTIRGATHFSSCDLSCADEPDTTPTIRREQAWSIGNAYSLAFLRFVAEGQLGYAPLLFGREGQGSALSPAGVFRSSDRAQDALVVDDFQGGTVGRNRLNQATSERNLDGGGDEPSVLQAAGQLPDPYAIYRLIYHHAETESWSGAHRLRWSRPDAAYGSELGGLDVRGRAAFVFRARSDGEDLPAGALRLRFVDLAGHSGDVALSAVGPRFTDVIAPLPALDPAVDRAALARVELLLGGSGTMVIDDLRFE